MIIDYQFAVGAGDAVANPNTTPSPPNIIIPTTLPYSESAVRSLRVGYMAAPTSMATVTLWALLEGPRFPPPPDVRTASPNYVMIGMADQTASGGSMLLLFESIREGKYVLQYATDLTGMSTGAILATVL